ncbi:MAG: glycogen debranching enzyme GlgX [Actinobacteria bacterium]|nr:glycogen debranching enzyme GlgX [Actinomycetota bacterium]
MHRRVWTGEPNPLGASYDGSGTNFAVFSSSAEQIELCLLGGPGEQAHDEHRIELTEVDGHIWHAYLPDVAPGQHYGYRVHGEWNPATGLWHNPNKLLLDPYAKRINGAVNWNPACFAYDLDDPDALDPSNSAPFVQIGAVHDQSFDWGDDALLRTPTHESVIYEAHVRGLTMRHPAVDPQERGTFAAIRNPAVLEHLVRLGITAIELMPIHQFVHDHHLVEQGRRNYWGYNTLGYFSAHNDYGSPVHADPATDFRETVKALHSVGIEVILDVVYNHTAEGNHLGPSLSMRGIDNHAYYRLTEENPRHYLDFTGCGNSLNMRHPHVLQLIMDSLRYWVLDMHVDGFRFDLASALARELFAVDRLSAFFDIIHQDPVLSQVKLIAEPWDVGEGGYQVGNFPPKWSEWNADYRDTMRDFWRGEHARLATFAQRFTGSSDLYRSDTRRPTASVNFITCHDGFTLNDLVSYNEKHNEENGEDSRDGESHNRSWNHGVEGPTNDETINELRDRQRRNLLTTLLLSQGVPMLLSGDELGRTQCGNNNAYCHDSDLSWIDWERVDQTTLDWVQRLLTFRSAHPIFRRRRWFHGRPLRDNDDMTWFRPDGTEMTPSDWEQGFAQAVGVFLNGEAISIPDRYGNRIIDKSFLCVFSASGIDLDWKMPPAQWGQSWITRFDSSRPSIGVANNEVTRAAEQFIIPSRTTMIFERSDSYVTSS